MTKTLEYYNENARTFSDQTQNVDFTETQERFLTLMPPQGNILDFGCGSGRDTKFFLERGYRVDAVDGSEELCRIASDYTGIRVRQMLFQDLDAVEQYDGIWACSSILHLKKEELRAVILKMITALKSTGYIYTSFKYGTFEGYRKQRYFTDFTEETMTDLIQSFPRLEIRELWISRDVRPDRDDETWLNLLLQKI
ncbi:MAG: class I SAM-dependent methyltransferase [Firmicutes bacterium]|nr:class I SAM-dependent methyltransferase [Bacillota bacterium]